ncbi:hypothetical protein D9M71_764650 [compost metagenome]
MTSRSYLVAVSLAAFFIASLSGGLSFKYFSILCANSMKFPGGNVNPFIPFCMYVCMPPIDEHIAGMPHAKASSPTSPNDSGNFVGNMKASNFL